MRGVFVLADTRSESDICFQITTQVDKVDDQLGLVMGYAIVCTEDGEPYHDLQGDHITENAMLKASLDFMEHSRLIGEMHARDDQGNVVKRGTVPFLFPLTEDIAESLDLSPRRTGLLIAMRPDADMLAKFRSGELTGFSIGGARITDEEVVDAA